MCDFFHRFIHNHVQSIFCLFCPFFLNFKLIVCIYLFDVVILLCYRVFHPFFFSTKPHALVQICFFLFTVQIDAHLKKMFANVGQLCKPTHSGKNVNLFQLYFVYKILYQWIPVIGNGISVEKLSRNFISSDEEIANMNKCLDVNNITHTLNRTRSSALNCNQV